MKIQTFSILAGSAACNSRCPYCVSKMTPPQGITMKEPEVNWRNFRKACLLAQHSGVTTAMITGKGEPILFPDQITKYLDAMAEFEFPMVELQTNGILMAEDRAKYDNHLRDWYAKGMTTIAVSIAHYEPEKNRQIFLPHKKSHIDLPGLVDYLHETGFSVRLACVLADGFICNSKSLEELISFAKGNKVEQLTVRPVNKPENNKDKAVHEWIINHHLKEEQKADIKSYLSEKGHQLMQLVHSATIYDVGGQNVCMTDSLTLDSNSEDIRQLIFFPDGHLRYDWQYEGAVIL